MTESHLLYRSVVKYSLVRVVLSIDIQLYVCVLSTRTSRFFNEQVIIAQVRVFINKILILFILQVNFAYLICI